MTIDGVTATHVVRPESFEQLAQAIRDEKGAIVPVGAGTQLFFGNPLRKMDCAVDLTGLDRITEYIPADLTIHVQAGLTLRELEHVLLQNNQFLPLDPWNGPDATLGGIAAANSQGPYRPTGTIRDWIIGMQVVRIDGTAAKAGGRVVKNVTGYDLARLYTGSLGCLAIIAEISLKLRARFARTATAITLTADSTDAAKLLSGIRHSEVQPVSCEWIGPENAVWVRFGEHPQAVDWQLKNLPQADWQVLEREEEAAAWESLRVRYSSLGSIVLRIVGLPSNIHEIIQDYQPSAWIAHSCNGIVLMATEKPADVALIRRKHRTVIEHAPIEVRREIATFGLNEAEFELMQRMKVAFDPEGRLNPGRHVDGER